MRTHSRVDAMVEDAYALLVDGDVPSALMLARQSVQLDPNHADARSVLGACLHAWHEPDEAVAAFTKAIELDPRGARFYFGRGRVHLDEGRFDRAAKDLQRANDIHPGVAACLSGLAVCAEARGDLNAAIRHLEDARLVDLANPDFPEALARLYLARGVSTWTTIENGDRVPTSYADVTSARQALKKIEALPVTQPDIVAAVADLTKAVKEAERRRFYATAKPGIMAIVLGVLMLAPTPLIGYALLGGGILYFVALRPPQYDLNRRSLKRSQMSRFDETMNRLYYQPDSTAIQMVAANSVGAGIALRIATGIFKVVTVPVMAVWALLENYDVADYLAIEAGKLKVFVGERLLDDPLLNRFRPTRPAA